MKLSELTRAQLEQLPDEAFTEIVFGGTADRGGCADVGILLGASLPTCAIRAEVAARVYLDGRIRSVIPCGGVEWEWENERISEARFMERILLGAGVPAEAILLENHSTTTKENMVCATYEIVHRPKIQNVRSALIITSASHLRRSLALAKLFLPRSITFEGVPAYSECETPAQWVTSPAMRDKVRREAQLLKGLVDDRLIDDIEF